MRPRRLVAAVAILWLAPASLVPSLLPQRLGQLTGFGELCVAAAVLAAAGGCAGAWALRHRGGASQRAALTAAAGVTGLVAGIWSSVVTAATAAAADIPAVWAPLWLFAWPAVMLAGVRVASGRPRARPASGPPHPGLPRVAIPADHPVVWQRSYTSGFFLAGAVLLAVLGAVVISVSAPLAAVAWGAAGLSVLLARLQLRLDDRGITLAPWGLSTREPLRYAHVAATTATQLHPLHWGGTRERILAGDSGLWLRPGPGLLIELTDGRRIGILMQSPEVPAGIINAQLDRRYSAAGTTQQPVNPRR